ncbi:MAG: molybdopterin molybdenumtransferase MoeA, partial [Calditrichaeota bacterium]|nr:molybdopterin molybdenumtransferase MoeA [Calditrichota bacterium]
ELVPYDAAPQPWQIRDSNGIMLRCAVESSGGVVRSSGQVGDDYQRTVAAVRQALTDSQIIIFSG